MLGKSSHATVLISSLLLATAVLIVPEAAFAIGGPGPASIFIGSEPESQAVQAGGSATIKVTVYPQNIWKTGNVSLNLLNPPPPWITATFSPGEVTNVTYDGFATTLEVKVAPDAPQKNVTLTIHGTGTAFGFFQKNGVPIPIKLDAQTDIVLKITAPPISTTTTTMTINSATTTTSTTTLSTTITSTITATTTERVADASTYPWALSATVATVVLAVVLMLQRRRK